MSRQPELPHIKITGGPTAIGMRCELDGVDISRYLSGITFSADVDAINRVTLHLIAVKVDIDADAAIAIENAVRRSSEEGFVDTTGLGGSIRQFARAEAVDA